MAAFEVLLVFLAMLLTIVTERPEHLSTRGRLCLCSGRVLRLSPDSKVRDIFLLIYESLNNNFQAKIRLSLPKLDTIAQTGASFSAKMTPFPVHLLENCRSVQSYKLAAKYLFPRKVVSRKCFREHRIKQKDLKLYCKTKTET